MCVGCNFNQCQGPLGERKTYFNIQLKIGMNRYNFCKEASRFMYKEEFIINNINNIIEQIDKLLLSPIM